MVGLELDGNSQIRFSILIGSRHDTAGDKLGFNRKCAEFKRQVDERAKLEGSANVILLGTVCTGRCRANDALPNGTDIDVLTESFPGIPILGSYVLGEYLPGACWTNGAMSSHSVWALISYLPDPTLRMFLLPDIVIDQNLGLDAPKKN